MRAAIRILRISSMNNSEIFTNSQMHVLVKVVESFIKTNNVDWIIIKEVGLLLENKGKDYENMLKLLTTCLIK